MQKFKHQKFFYWKKIASNWKTHPQTITESEIFSKNRLNKLFGKITTWNTFLQRVNFFQNLSPSTLCNEINWNQLLKKNSQKQLPTTSTSFKQNLFSGNTGNKTSGLLPFIGFIWGQSYLISDGTKSILSSGVKEDSLGFLNERLHCLRSISLREPNNQKKSLCFNPNTENFKLSFLGIPAKNDSDREEMFPFSMGNESNSSKAKPLPSFLEGKGNAFPSLPLVRETGNSKETERKGNKKKVKAYLELQKNNHSLNTITEICSTNTVTELSSNNLVHVSNRKLKSPSDLQKIREVENVKVIKNNQNQSPETRQDFSKQNTKKYITYFPFLVSQFHQKVLTNHFLYRSSLANHWYTVDSLFSNFIEPLDQNREKEPFAFSSIPLPSSAIGKGGKGSNPFPLVLNNKTKLEQTKKIQQIKFPIKIAQSYNFFFFNNYFKKLRIESYFNKIKKTLFQQNKRQKSFSPFSGKNLKINPLQSYEKACFLLDSLMNKISFETGWNFLPKKSLLVKKQKFLASMRNKDPEPNMLLQNNNFYEKSFEHFKISNSTPFLFNKAIKLLKNSKPLEFQKLRKLEKHEKKLLPNNPCKNSFKGQKPSSLTKIQQTFNELLFLRHLKDLNVKKTASTKILQISKFETPFFLFKTPSFFTGVNFLHSSFLAQNINEIPTQMSHASLKSLESLPKPFSCITFFPFLAKQPVAFPCLPTEASEATHFVPSSLPFGCFASQREETVRKKGRKTGNSMEMERGELRKGKRSEQKHKRNILFSVDQKRRTKFKSYFFKRAKDSNIVFGLTKPKKPFFLFRQNLLIKFEHNQTNLQQIKKIKRRTTFKSQKVPFFKFFQPFLQNFDEPNKLVLRNKLTKVKQNNNSKKSEKYSERFFELLEPFWKEKYFLKKYSLKWQFENDLTALIPKFLFTPRPHRPFLSFNLLYRPFYKKNPVSFPCLPTEASEATHFVSPLPFGCFASQREETAKKEEKKLRNRKKTEKREEKWIIYQSQKKAVNLGDRHFSNFYKKDLFDGNQ